MDKTLVSLRESIVELRQKGAERGLSDADLDLCMINSLKHTVRNCTKNTTARKSGKKAAANLAFNKWFAICVKYAVGCVLVLGLFSLIVFCVCLIHYPTELYMMQVVQPYVYGVMRMARLATLPITRRMDISGLYEAECLILNPYYVKPEAEPCLACFHHDIDHVNRTSNLTLDEFHDTYIYQGMPVIITDLHPGSVTFDRLQAAFRGTPDLDTKADTTSVESNDVRVTSLRQLMTGLKESEILHDPVFHLIWTTSHLNHGRLLRKIFPRLQILHETVEIDYQKSVFVDGPQAASYSLPEAGLEDMFYIQGSGTRRLVLRPEPKSFCPKLSVTMLPGELLYVGRCWKIQSHPAETTDDVSISVLASFV